MKRIGNNIHRAKGKRGYVGKMITTADILSGREKRKYQKSGRVINSNIYEQLLSFDDLQTYSPETQKTIITKWKQLHSKDKIIHALGLSAEGYKKLLVNLCMERTDNMTKHKISKGILTRKEFDKKSKEDQFYLMDIWTEELGSRAIAEKWAAQVQTVHNKKYHLKKRMQKLGKDIYNNPWMMEKDKEKGNNADSTIFDYKTTRGIQKPASDPSNEESEVLANDVTTYDDRMTVSHDDDMIEKDVAGLATNEKKRSNLTSEYYGEKEGFLAYTEIYDMLQLLKKSTNTYKINITIEKVDDE